MKALMRSEEYLHKCGTLMFSPPLILFFFSINFIKFVLKMFSISKFNCNIESVICISLVIITVCSDALTQIEKCSMQLQLRMITETLVENLVCSSMFFKLVTDSRLCDLGDLEYHFNAFLN